MEIQNQAQRKQKVQDDNEEIQVDRLSSLPDLMIYHILSFLDTKDAVRTSVLSKKWTQHWTFIDRLVLDSKTFTKWKDFRKFVIRVFRYRKPIKLSSLIFYGKVTLLDKVLCYAYVFNPQQLKIFVDGKPANFHIPTDPVPDLCLDLYNSMNFPSSFGYASLTTLELFGDWSLDIDQSVALFSGCVNLEKLSLMDCILPNVLSFNICSPKLVKLEISNLRFHLIETTPQLVIFAPKLRSFCFFGTHPWILNMTNCLTLEEVYVSLSSCTAWYETTLRKELYIWPLIAMAEGLSHAQSLKIQLTFMKGKFVLYRSGLDAETELVEISETYEILSLMIAELREKVEGLKERLRSGQLELSNHRALMELNGVRDRQSDEEEAAAGMIQMEAREELRNKQIQLRRLRAVVQQHKKRLRKMENLIQHPKYSGMSFDLLPPYLPF